MGRPRADPNHQLWLPGTGGKVEAGLKFTVEAVSGWHCQVSKRCAGRNPPTLEACVLLDPVSEAGEAAVHARLVPLGTAIAPAHHPGQEHAARGLRADQGPPRVPLHTNTHTA